MVPVKQVEAVLLGVGLVNPAELVVPVELLVTLGSLRLPGLMMLLDHPLLPPVGSVSVQ